MKKVFFLLGFAIAGILLLFTVKPTVAKAVNTPNTIAVTVHELTSDYTVDIGNNTFVTYAHEGDFEVLLTIENNTGYAGSGMGLYYDKNNFDPCMPDPSDPTSIECYYTTGPALINLSPSILVNRSQGRFGLTTNGTTNNTNDGLMMRVFLTRKDNAPDPDAIPYVGTVVTQLVTAKNYDVSYYEPTCLNTGFIAERRFLLNYRLGDLDGDGNVTMADANLLSSILANSTSINASTAESRARALTGVTLDGLFHNTYDIFEDTFIFSVIDINNDGVITSADITQINNYVMAGILDMDPEDLGCVPGINAVAEYAYSVYIMVS